MNQARVFLAACAVVGAIGCGGESDGTMMSDVDGGGTPMTPDATATTGDAGRATEVAPGGACRCDSECAGTATHAGLCVRGVCMARASAACASAGSSAECPSGSRCWGLEGFDGGICWPDCAAVASCAGTCDSDGSCAPATGSTCDGTCSAVCMDTTPPGECPPNSHPQGDGCVCDEGFTVNEDRTACVPQCMTAADCTGGDVCMGGRCVAPPCTATSCPAGTMCAPSGVCVIDIGMPPPGPPPERCRIGSEGIPDWRCTGSAAECGALVPFEPVRGPGYWNYPLNGETEMNQYRSFVRRDVMMLVKYATAMVACQARDWMFGNGGDLGLGDMSEADGSIPGTSVGSPGHPAGTHVNGHDMDIAYYQTGTSDNRLRAVCEHTRGGADQYHCVGAPTMLDPWRTALFIAHLHISPNLRVIGVVGQVGPPVTSATTQLCAGGWVSGTACTSPRTTYETTDMGRGWYLFHHHHLHISVSAPR